MKAAVVYYSMSGNVQYVAEQIAERIDADLIRLEPVTAYPDSGFRKFFWGGKSAVMGEKPELNPYEFPADKYDAVILGAPIWAGRIAPPLLSFLTKEKAALEGKKVSAFLCSAGGGTDKAMAQIRQLLGVDSLAAELSLVNPKTSPKSENDHRVESFCGKVQ